MSISKHTCTSLCVNSNIYFVISYLLPLSSSPCFKAIILANLTNSYGKSNHLVAHVSALDCIHMDKVDLKANVKLIMLETWNYSMTQ